MKAVNLLPSDLKPAPGRTLGAPKMRTDVDRPYGAYGVLVALALVLVGVVALVLAGNGVTEREGELAAAKAEQQTVAAEAAKLASFGEFRALAANRVATVRSLADARFDWEQALRDLSRAIPSNVTLENISGSVAPGASFGGGGGNALRGAIPKPAIELKGCTIDQRAVATLMARLRAVQGATRVSVSKSTRRAATESSTPQAAASDDAEPEGCGPGSPAEFELVVFFEGAPPASGAPAPAASTTPAPAAAGAAATPAPPAGAATPAASSTPAPGAPASATPAPGAPAATSAPAPAKEGTTP